MALHREIELDRVSSLDMLRRQLARTAEQSELCRLFVVCDSHWPRHTLFRLSEAGGLLLRATSGLLRGSHRDIDELLTLLEAAAEHHHHVSVVLCASTGTGELDHVRGWLDRFVGFSKRGQSVRQRLLHAVDRLAAAVAAHEPLEDCGIDISALLYAAEADTFLYWDEHRRQFLPIG
jgi:hypothetical protein